MKIFRLLGTPTEACWPVVTSLADFMDEFPRWQAPQTPGASGCPSLSRESRYDGLATKLGSAGLDLLWRLLCYEPQRIDAVQALAHPYFSGL